MTKDERGYWINLFNLIATKTNVAELAVRQIFQSNSVEAGAHDARKRLP